MRRDAGLTLFCDPGVAGALTSVSKNSGFDVACLSAPPASMLAQIIRHTRDDVLFTRASAMDQAVAAGLVLPASRRDGFTVTYVLAGRAGAAPARAPRIAVTDDTPASELDGRALLSANNISAGSIIGTATTADAAYLVLTGAADAALIMQTELRGHKPLGLIAVLTAPPALSNYAMAVNAHAFSPQASGFCAWLAGPAARPALIAAGFSLA